MAERLPFTAARDGLRLTVRLTPKASADRITGVIEDGSGGCALKASVTAPPVDGAANEALLRLLGRHFHLKQRDLAIHHGTTGRSKLIDISGDPAVLGPLLKKGLSPWLRQS